MLSDTVSSVLRVEVNEGVRDGTMVQSEVQQPVQRHWGIVEVGVGGWSQRNSGQMCRAFGPLQKLWLSL